MGNNEFFCDDLIFYDKNMTFRFWLESGRDI